MDLSLYICVTVNTMSNVEKSLALLGLPSEGTAIGEAVKAYRWVETFIDIAKLKSGPHCKERFFCCLGTALLYWVRNERTPWRFQS